MGAKPVSLRIKSASVNGVLLHVFQLEYKEFHSYTIRIQVYHAYKKNPEWENPFQGSKLKPLSKCLTARKTPDGISCFRWRTVHGLMCRRNIVFPFKRQLIFCGIHGASLTSRWSI